jgi:hypothetical protein
MTATGARYEAMKQGLKHYTSNKPCKHGHLSLRVTGSGSCIECRRIQEMQRYYANIPKVREATLKRYYANQETLIEKARVARATESSEKRAARLEKAKIQARQWRANNPRHHNALTTAHKKVVKQRTPAWADMQKIVEFYKNCPEGCQVDHIIPLRGKTVSGLHIVDNLQYLTAKENRNKSNYYEVS